MLLTLLLACATTPPPDDETRALALLEAGDVAGAAAIVEAQPGPEAKIALTLRLARRSPRADALCDALPTGETRVRCRQTTRRPHLIDTPQPGVAPDRPGEGPGSADLDAMGVEPILNASPAPPPECEEDPDPTGCRTRLARDLAAGGRSGEAITVCQRIEPGTWQHQCYFESAENAVQVLGASAYASSVDLCLMSGPFVDRCQEHLLIVLGDTAPPSGAGPAGWTRAIEAADAVGAAWEARSPDKAPIARGQFWSLALNASYRGTISLGGGPLDALPEDARPFVRATVARRLLSAAEDPAEHDLAGWVALLDETLKRRPHDPPPEVGDAPMAPKAVDLWRMDRGGDAQIEAVPYGGAGSRRGLAEDRSADLAICVLEAAARLDHPPMGLLAEAEGWPDQTVQWTATRLQAEIKELASSGQGSTPQ